MFILDPGSRFFPSWIPDPGVKKATGPDPKHCQVRLFSMHPLAGGRYYGHQRATPEVMYHNVRGWEGSWGGKVPVYV
jgi:hypothetical protein